MPRGCTPESILGQEAQMQDWKMSFRGRHQLLLCRPYLSLNLRTFSWEFFFSKFFTFQFSGSVFVIHSRVALSILILSVVQGLRDARLFWAKSWLATLLCGVQCTWVGGWGFCFFAEQGDEQDLQLCSAPPCAEGCKRLKQNIAM